MYVRVARATSNVSLITDQGVRLAYPLYQPIESLTLLYVPRPYNTAGAQEGVATVYAPYNPTQNPTSRPNPHFKPAHLFQALNQAYTSHSMAIHHQKLVPTNVHRVHH